MGPWKRWRAWRRGGTSMAKKVRRKRPRINIHSCSTLFERLAYPRIERDPLWARFSLSLSLRAASSSSTFSGRIRSWKFEMPRPGILFRFLPRRPPSPPSPSSSLLLRFLFARRPSLSPNARSTPLHPARLSLARPFRPGNTGPEDRGP